MESVAVVHEWSQNARDGDDDSMDHETVELLNDELIVFNETGDMFARDVAVGSDK